MENKRKRGFDDALEYYYVVKHRLKDDEDKFSKFVEVLNDFKAHRIRVPGVAQRVKEFFKDHRTLILGFNAFLPRDHQIRLPAISITLTRQHATNYLHKVKTRFQSEEHVYTTFINILRLYRLGDKSVAEAYEEVARLFNQHVDLVEEYTYFLPGFTGSES